MKFLVSADRAARVLDWARSRLEPDPHAGGPAGDEYRTTTIYFDTDDRAVYQRRGSYGRSKYRIRRYGASEVAFLERKLRTSCLLSKRRTTIDEGQLPGLMAANQGNRPSRWFVERVTTRRLAPICQVSYRRHARVGMGPYGPMRLTFDDNIRALPNGTTIFAPDGGIPVLSGQVIVEMKYCVETPAVLKQLVEQFTLSPAPISKYRLSVAELTAGIPESSAVKPAGDRRTVVGLAGLASA